MLPSVRKDLEELEMRLDSMLGKQAELESAVSALRVHLTSIVQGEINNLETGIAQNFEAQSQWLASRLSNLRGELGEQNALDKSEVIASIAAFETRQHRQIESLRAQFAEQFKTMQAGQEEHASRLELFENAWRERDDLSINDTSEQSVKEWSEAVGTRLKKFAESQGMPRFFAWQLLRELKELTELNQQFASKETGWDERLDELQRVLFSLDRAMPWTCLTPHNSTETQRRELRALETAVAQMRSYVQEKLLTTHGIRPLEIVPRMTPFDASVHESNEFLEVPTSEADKHNLILSVEQPGFQKVSPWGETQLLRPARVRRYVLQDETVSPTVDVENFEVESPPESRESQEDVLRVSGQL